MFKVWLEEKEMNSVSNWLRKASMDRRLLEFIPSTKRSEAYFEKYFTDAGLPQLVTFQKELLHDDNKNSFKTELKELMEKESPPTATELIPVCKDMMSDKSLKEVDVAKLIWNCIMEINKWNKKKELVADQALRHIEPFAPLLNAFTTQGRTEMVLLYEIQEYCITNINFMETFPKLIILLCKNDILSEDQILEWRRDEQAGKGKSIFQDKMKDFVEWLKNPEEGDPYVSRSGLHLSKNSFLKNSFKNKLKELMEKESPPTATQLIPVCKDMMSRMSLEEIDVAKLIWNCIMEIIEKKELVADQALCHIRLIPVCKDMMSRVSLKEVDVAKLIWNCIMEIIEKKELDADQALRHIKPFAPLLSAFTTQGRTEMVLLDEIQEYCITNINFMETIPKLIILLYNKDVLSEDQILEWSRDEQASEEKSVFVDKLTQFVEWLENAEEESDEDDED